MAHTPALQRQQKIKVLYCWTDVIGDTACWSVLVSQTSLQELDCSCTVSVDVLYRRTPRVPPSLVSCVKQLVNHTSLNVEGHRLQGDEVQQLIDCLQPCFLERLNLAENMLDNGLNLSVASSFGKFSNLRSLKISIYA